MSTAQGHLRTIKLGHKHTHYIYIYVIYTHFSSQSTKPVLHKKTYIHKHKTQLFEELDLLKELVTGQNTTSEMYCGQELTQRH